MHLQEKYVARWRHNMGRVTIARRGVEREGEEREVRQEKEEEGKERRMVVIETGDKERELLKWF